MRRLTHKPVALTWRQRPSFALRARAAANLASGVYEQASTLFPTLTNPLLLNLTYTTPV